MFFMPAFAWPRGPRFAAPPPAPPAPPVDMGSPLQAVLTTGQPSITTGRRRRRGFSLRFAARSAVRVYFMLRPGKALLSVVFISLAFCICCGVGWGLVLGGLGGSFALASFFSLIDLLTPIAKPTMGPRGVTEEAPMPVRAAR